MQVPLQITMRNVDHSEAVEQRIRDKALKLNQFSDRIIACEVVVEQNLAKRVNGNTYNIRVHVNLPRKDLVVNHTEQENLYLAIREAFDNMVRKVEEADRIMDGEVKHHEPMLQGEIVRLFDEGFGFIRDGGGDEYYFNKDNLVSEHFDKLQIGMEVHFIEKMGDEGLRACRVSVRRNGRH